MSRGPKIGIGPANYAGQAGAWAEAHRSAYNSGTFSFGYENAGSAFRFSTDRQIGRLRRVSPSKFAQNASAISDAEAIVIDGFLSVSGSIRLASFKRQMKLLDRSVDSIAFLSHGTDTRDPRRHMERLSYSYYRDAPLSYRIKCRDTSRRNRKIARQSGRLLFVSTPDLLLDNPDAIWFPVVVNTAIWKPTSNPFPRTVPRVLHLPSRSHPPIKGTAHIDPVLRRLELEGLISYETGAQRSHADMPAAVASVDIVVDQIQSGFYGVAAVEAMAVGKLVIGNVAGDVRERVPLHIPIVDANPNNFEELMRDVLRNRDKLAAMATEGPEFARTFHDGSYSARVLNREMSIERESTD
ncbi:glycosyltransferase [Dietzia kunjamensis]|uniref:glycosyltransferase n=1 Tax=Dietzia kunjamensis TaxID=322509 RepID=UPI002097AD9B|nr:hypothetical protein [Dietzia kunjamensis]USX45210.1 hypothetical protein NHB83_13340 [Dietzia kunjamensis]